MLYLKILNNHSRNDLTILPLMVVGPRTIISASVFSLLPSFKHHPLLHIISGKLFEGTKIQHIYIYRCWRSVKALVRQIWRKIWKPKNLKCIFFAGRYPLSHPWGNSGEKIEGQRIQSMIREFTQEALTWRLAIGPICKKKLAKVKDKATRNQVFGPQTILQFTTKITFL